MYFNISSFYGWSEMHCQRFTTSRLALSTLSPLFVDRFERSLWIRNLEFDKEAISDFHL